MNLLAEDLRKIQADSLSLLPTLCLTKQTLS